MNGRFLKKKVKMRFYYSRLVQLDGPIENIVGPLRGYFDLFIG